MMYVDAYETISRKNQIFLQHALFCHVCDRSLFIFFYLSILGSAHENFVYSRSQVHAKIIDFQVMM